MKATLATAMILALGITGFSLWGAVHAQRRDVSSSQIFIHGTPVCVMHRAGEIVASVGICGTPGGDWREDAFGNGGGSRGRRPSPLGPRPGLPPGHPPVDAPMGLEEEQRILI